MTKYTTWCNRQGGCGHVHGTKDEARACLAEYTEMEIARWSMCHRRIIESDSEGYFRDAALSYKHYAPDYFGIQLSPAEVISCG